MRRFIALAFVALTACGGGAGDGGLGDTPFPPPPDQPPYDWPGIPPPVPQPDPDPVIHTANGRFGVFNANLPTITALEVLTQQGVLVREYEGLSVQAGAEWEAPVGEDVAPGVYIVRAYLSFGTAAKVFLRTVDADGPVLTAADYEYGF